MGLVVSAGAFQNSQSIVRSIRATSTQSVPTSMAVSTNNNDTQGEAKKLLERAAQLRAEIAQAEGKTIQQVQDEAKSKKEEERRRIEHANLQKEADKAEHNKTKDPGRYLVQVPNTVDDMVRQAARAVERALQDGITRQTVRFNLVTENQPATEESEWPGGTRQMYREAGKPLADALLREVRAPTKHIDQMVEERRLAPTLKAQDIWDFDGTALHTAEAAEDPVPISKP